MGMAPAQLAARPVVTGEELRNARLAAGLTQAQLAVRADCSLGSLGNMEAGVIPRRSAVLERVVVVLSSTNEGPAGNGTLEKAEHTADVEPTQAA